MASIFMQLNYWYCGGKDFMGCRKAFIYAGWRLVPVMYNINKRNLL